MDDGNEDGLIDFDADGVERVVADPLRFKRQLQIGEEAFAILRAKKRLWSLWDVGGAAATGAGVASSSAVAGTFFAPTGLAAWLGMASAATPIGWVVAAALLAGGGYYGFSRWVGDQNDKFVETIPKYITTPIDVLGDALVRLLGALALRVAAIDGRIAPLERECIVDHFEHDWGMDRTYVERMLDALAPHADETRVKVLANTLADFTGRNPDCNASAMHQQIMVFLREVMTADGIVDEREELAIEAIGRTFAEANRITVAKAGVVVSEAALSATQTAAAIGQGLSKAIYGAAGRLRKSRPDDGQQA